MHQTIRQRFLRAESDYLELRASGLDASALTRFSVQWTILHDDFEDAFRSGLLDDSDIDVAYAVASRVAALGESLSQLENDLGDMTADYLSQVEAALAQLSLADVSSSPPDPPLPKALVSLGSLASPLRPQTYSHPYVAPLYAWLVHNLHNPYPCSSVKNSLAKQVSLSPQSVTNWFKAVRRQVGWSALCKTHYRGQRSIAVSHAGQLFKGYPSSIPIYPAAIPQFFAIKSKLDNLYLVERGIGIDVNGGGIGCKRSRSSSLSSSSVSSTTTESDAYSPASSNSSPSPAPSTDQLIRDSPPHRMPSLVFSSSSDTEDDDPLPELYTNQVDICGGIVGAYERPSKRRRSTYDEESGNRAAIEEPVQWLADSVAFPVDVNTVLPLSPIDMGFTNLDLPCTEVYAAAQPSSLSEPIICTIRKRRFSDADTQHPNKRPRTIVPGAARSHAVSDPLPSQVVGKDGRSAWDEWMSEFESWCGQLPAPVTALDPSVQIDIHVHDFLAPHDSEQHVDSGGIFDPVCSLEVPGHTLQPSSVHNDALIPSEIVPSASLESLGLVSELDGSQISKIKDAISILLNTLETASCANDAPANSLSQLNTDDSTPLTSQDIDILSLGLSVQDPAAIKSESSSNAFMESIPTAHWDQFFTLHEFVDGVQNSVVPETSQAVEVPFLLSDLLDLSALASEPTDELVVADPPFDVLDFVNLPSEQGETWKFEDLITGYVEL
ncbi:hypothetical protein PHLCEN_2v3816 [Hermanssonia centrifuga]|uniref:Homeobox domain-containing protein n=1 Tax=Hermanssonia centrifuga TaxID=98765 RepID=A0A2R6QBD5_9APHY|nr:hypothetical protein PHLCEN_2v3816 [Hermanssonia centrifuga]